MTIILLIYQLALLALMPFAIAFSAFKALSNPRYRTGWAERFGFWKGSGGDTLWVHGASMGELRAASPLIKALKERDIPLTLSATTETGVTEARKLVGDSGSAHYLPFDLLPCILLALCNFKPRALVIIETELWPALLWLVRRRGVPVLLVSARVSQRSYPRYRRIQKIVSWMLNGMESIQPQSLADAKRFISLGAAPKKVSVAGNMKFDLPAPDTSDPLASMLRATASAGWRVFVAGSVHPVETLEVAKGAKAVLDRGAKVGLVIAPRHLEKLEQIEKEIKEAGFGTLVRWSALKEPREQSLLAAFEAGSPVIVDGFGLLGSLYGGATVSYVGGSLVNVGGHNLLEPLNWGVPVLFGPHMQNAAEIRDEIVRQGLGTEVGSAQVLSGKLLDYLGDDGATAEFATLADNFFKANRGAVHSALRALEQCGALAVDAGEGEAS
jgi:3-deoxy-D-manno-octulosonic-acid transferase